MAVRSFEDCVAEYNFHLIDFSYIPISEFSSLYVPKDFKLPSSRIYITQLDVESEETAIARLMLCGQEPIFGKQLSALIQHTALYRPVGFTSSSVEERALVQEVIYPLRTRISGSVYYRPDYAKMRTMYERMLSGDETF